MSDHHYDGQYVTPPADLKRAWSVPARAAHGIAESRAAIRRILDGTDDRLLVIVGPCSIHDPAAALDYAARLSTLRQTLDPDLEIVMRAYFEKPRTRVGWKGLINDPHLDESHDIEAGLRIARTLLVAIAAHALPVATEFLGAIDQHYFADCIAWGAIGARTTESQLHREMASGLPFPIGFKNGTDGNLGIAIDAIRAAQRPHHFLGVNDAGRVVVRRTHGNPGGHLVLRGGRVPNHDAQSVTAACALLASHALTPRVVIDVSHGNSSRVHENQIPVCASLAARIATGDTQLAGVMIESNLVAGHQTVGGNRALVYGQSITDACIGWDETTTLLEHLASAVRARRRATRMRDDAQSAAIAPALHTPHPTQAAHHADPR